MPGDRLASFVIRIKTTTVEQAKSERFGVPKRYLNFYFSAPLHVWSRNLCKRYANGDKICRPVFVRRRTGLSDRDLDASCDLQNFQGSVLPPRILPALQANVAAPSCRTICAANLSSGGTPLYCTGRKLQRSRLDTSAQ